MKTILLVILLLASIEASIISFDTNVSNNNKDGNYITINGNNIELNNTSIRSSVKIKNGIAIGTVGVYIGR
ncbi:MAG TPA: hypothetical protein EYG73_00330 [Arcobacter sp.]|nr:hypothetical protein [Arcobacter sp.]